MKVITNTNGVQPDPNNQYWLYYFFKDRVKLINRYQEFSWFVIELEFDKVIQRNCYDTQFLRFNKVSFLSVKELNSAMMKEGS